MPTEETGYFAVIFNKNSHLIVMHFRKEIYSLEYSLLLQLFCHIGLRGSLTYNFS